MKSRKTNTDTSLEQHKRIQNKFKTHVKGRVLISISGDPFRGVHVAVTATSKTVQKNTFERSLQQ